MSAIITPFKRLKWGFLPQRRIVDEDEFGNFIDSGEDSIKSSEKEEISEKVSDTKIFEKESPEDKIYEYRDEKDRPWWKFFDEYEYRVQTKVKKNRKWYHWFHDDDTYEEKKLILKLDLLLTFYSMVAYWIKYLDTVNLTNAYISGLYLPKDQGGINMVKNDLINTQTVFNVGTVVFQLAAVIVVYEYPLTYSLPISDMLWSILTIVTAEVKSVGGLQAVRFLIGVCESLFYPAYHSLLAGWFIPTELNRRAGLYYIGQFLGVLSSGLISGGIENAFGNTPGQVWRWIFRIDGIASFVVGILGLYMLPGTPSDCYSIFLTDEDIRVARRRMKRANVGSKPRKDALKKFFDKNVWKSIFSTWHFYVLSIWCIFLWNNTSGPQGAYPLWLKFKTREDGTPSFTGSRLQNFTSLTPSLGILYLILVCCYADFFQSRWSAIVISQIFNFVGNLLLAIWNIPEGAKWFAWVLQYWSWSAAPVVYAWQGDICRFDFRKRQVLLFSMNIIAQTFSVWITRLTWSTVEAPRYLKGFSFITASTFALIVWTFLVLYLYKKQEREHAKENGIILYNSDKDGEVASEIVDGKVDKFHSL
ncbi:SEO1 [Candida pseudojiufengensis]|uniref:SEO1 n=1 Tax=Candida pseudojiufengensis TaxID=497109 RepID=UPI002224DA30|nr:SEO1 [Candida pseudojiufengensis]KAI5962345.1 SEO1 [Candida pseudojiufengensis]